MAENAQLAVVAGSGLPTQNDDRKFVIEMSGLGSNDNFEESVRKMKEGQLQKSSLNVAVQYFDFEMNKTETFMFLGLTELRTQDGELLPALMLMDAKKNSYINQATILVDAIMKANLNIYQWVDITWTGAKKTGKGNQVRLWSVYPYN